MSNQQSDTLPPSIGNVGLKWKIHLRQRIAGDVLLVDLDFGGDNPTQPYGPAASFGVSIPTFEGDEELAKAWLDRLTDGFFDGLKQTLIDSLRLLLVDAGSQASIDSGFSFFDQRGLIASHLTLAEVLLHQRLGLAPQTKWPPWTAQELSAVILQTMQSTPNVNPTYESVAKKIQVSFPGRPPTTGEALRKVVKDYGINWMKLKRVAKKRSQ